jgi:putative SbcD/Mre11-related phosphoesterase
LPYAVYRSTFFSLLRKIDEMDNVEIQKGLFATPYRFLWLPRTQTAILADVHLGAAASLRRQGLYLPEEDYCGGIWLNLLSYKPSHVVIAGDLFDFPQAGADERALRTLRELTAACRVTITPGNHDPIEFAASGCEIVPQMEVEGLTISHGHRALEKMPGAWIVGHQHPAVILSTRVQRAKMACYAACGIGGGRLILLPAFSRMPLGSNLLTGSNWLLPVRRPEKDQMRIYGLIEPQPPRLAQVMDFGCLGGLGE